MKCSKLKESLLKIQGLLIISQSILKVLKSTKKKSHYFKMYNKLEKQKANVIFYRMKFHSNQWDLQKIVMNVEFRYYKTMYKVR